MNKHQLIQAVEKARGQTRCEANRMLDLLSGVTGDPLAKSRRVIDKSEKHPLSKDNKALQNKA